MYERFTDRARKVMQLANQEAQRLHHEYIGTEHILLGLMKEGSGVAANVLKNLNVDLRTIRLEVEKILVSGPLFVSTRKLPQTPKARKVIDSAIEEARNLGHNYVGTEHLLLGLLHEQDCVAYQVLLNLDLKADRVRACVLQLLGQPKAGPDLKEFTAGVMELPWQPLPPSGRFERFCRQAGLAGGRHPGLLIFGGGLLATLLGARIGLDVLGWEDPNSGALVAGVCYVAGIAFSSFTCASSYCGRSCKER
jgi:hypothetical protein